MAMCSTEEGFEPLNDGMKNTLDLEFTDGAFIEKLDSLKELRSPRQSIQCLFPSKFYSLPIYTL